MSTTIQEYKWSFYLSSWRDNQASLAFFCLSCGNVVRGNFLYLSIGFPLQHTNDFTTGFDELGYINNDIK